MSRPPLRPSAAFPNEGGAIPEQAFRIFGKVATFPPNQSPDNDMLLYYHALTP